jgi:hypothetical protein
MSLTLACPSCGHRGRVPDTFRGRKVECPRCKSRFPVPPAAAASLPKPGGAAPPTGHEDAPEALVADEP